MQIWSRLAGWFRGGGGAGGPASVAETIRALEEYVRKHREPFPWAQHNELRHLYADRSEAESMRHADIILAHSLMDDYILDILAGWQRGKDDGAAAINLMAKAEADRFDGLPHLRAACLIAAGDLHGALGRPAKAERMYRRARGLAGAGAGATPTLASYRELAEYRLDLVEDEA